MVSSDLRIKGHHQRGFTVLELLAVFAILAVIAAVAVPKYQTVVKESKIKACQNNVEMLTRAAEMYYELNHTWPTEQQLFTGKYINEYVYCPLASQANESTDYDISSSGVVSCGNAANHNAE